MHAFIDESRRRGEYLLAWAEVAAADVDAVRRSLRALRLPGQRRLHFVDERDQRRQRLLAAFARLPMRAGVVVSRLGSTHEAGARGDALALILTLLDPDVDRLIIESRRGRDQDDRRAIAAHLRGTPRLRRLHYEHRMPHEDPGLWVPDGIAWAAGAGGRWRMLLDELPVTICRIDT